VVLHRGQLGDVDEKEAQASLPLQDLLEIGDALSIGEGLGGGGDPYVRAQASFPVVAAAGTASDGRAARSTVDAAGHERTGATGDAWAALIGVALVSGLAVAAVVRRRPDAVLRAPLAGLATFIVLYAWRASQARVKGGNLWPLGLIGVVLPIGLLGTFGGSWLALRTIRARNHEREQRGDGAEP
jgi:LPXTG-motif cell wall-anchored protein